jgi:hypothetical protein
MKRDNTRGVIYCATGNKKYLFLSIISGLQFRYLNPETSVTIITDLRIGKFLIIQLFEKGIDIKYKKFDQGNPMSSRATKTQIYKFSPFKNTLFLDADVVPLKNCDEIWEHSQPNIVSLVRGTFPTLADVLLHGIPEITHTREVVPQDYANYDTAIILFTKSAEIKHFFEQWYYEWCIYKNIDHYACMRALYTCKIKINELPRKYNIYVDAINTENYFKTTFLHLSKEVIDWPTTIKVIKVLAPESYHNTMKIFNYTEQEVLNIDRR